jgi:hypothetical protein
LSIIGKSKITSTFPAAIIFATLAPTQKLAIQYFGSRMSYLYRRESAPYFQSLNLAYFRFFLHDSPQAKPLKTNKPVFDRFRSVELVTICIHLLAKDPFQLSQINIY